MSLSKRLRFEVFKRDKFTCQYCGRKAPDVVLQADHIHPVSQGGEDDIVNLLTSCVECNAGKGPRLVGDDTVVAKQRDQLTLLQERREQIEMMLDWQKGLIDLDVQVVDRIAEHWCDLANWYDVTDDGKRDLKRLIRKFGEQAVLEAMQLAMDTYFKYPDEGDTTTPTDESANHAFNKIGGICRVREASKEKPYLQDLFYIRGIIRNRLTWVDLPRAKTILEAAYSWGADTEELKDIARRVTTWTKWQNEMAEYIGELKKADEEGASGA